MERQPYTVAVVDDDPSIGRSIQRLLKAHGFAAEVFPSAEAFLDRDPDSCVACLVLDIHLPGMSGLELRRRLTAAGSILPVIFVTAIDDDAVKMAAIQLGCRVSAQAVSGRSFDRPCQEGTVGTAHGLK